MGIQAITKRIHANTGYDGANVVCIETGEGVVLVDTPMLPRDIAHWKEFVLGPDGMMFNKRDGEEFVQTVKWFLHRGPRPEYGRWTYWEKFDYFAVFWGVAMIGFSGLVLWFPHFFCAFLPGHVLNIAKVIHSTQALLATGFVFAIHFFNTHFRPDKFPQDTTMFTGRVPLEVYKHEHRREYERLD